LDTSEDWLVSIEARESRTLKINIEDFV